MIMISRTQAAEAATRTVELLENYNEALDKLESEIERAEEFRKGFNASCAELHKVRELVSKGMTCEGYCPKKQWYLVQIAKACGMVIYEDIEQGIAP